MEEGVVGSSAYALRCFGDQLSPFSPILFLVYKALTELAPDLEGKGGAFLAEPGKGGGALRDRSCLNQHPTLPNTVPRSMQA